MADRIELLQGTLDLLILQVLQWGPQHGYGISLAIKASSKDLLIVDTGSLYPALHRLEKNGWIKSEWGVSENNRKAKFYSITKRGLKQLAIETSNWETFSGVIGRVLRLEDPRKA